MVRKMIVESGRQLGYYREMLECIYSLVENIVDIHKFKNIKLNKGVEKAVEILEKHGIDTTKILNK